MKNFDYIELIINESVTYKLKLRFISRLINDPEFRKQYHQYLQIAEEIQKQEDIIRSVNQDLKGYAFNINKVASLHDIQDIHGDICRMVGESRIIRSVINANRPPKPGERKGWFRAAAVLSIFILAIAVGIKSATDLARCRNIIVYAI